MRKSIATLVAVTLGVAGALVGTVALAARDSSGTYSLSPTSPFVTGTAISSSVMNTRFADLASEMTDSASRSGKGSYLAALRLFAGGSAAVPELTWDGDTDSGLYNIGADNIGLSLGGTKRWDFGAAGSTLTGNLSVSGTSTLTGNSTVGGTLGVTGAATLSSTLASGAITAPSVAQGTANSSLTLTGNRSGADSGADVVVNSAATRTAGSLFEVENNGAAKFKLNSDGEPSLQGGYALGWAFKTDADQADGTGGTPIAITGLSFPVEANGVYVWELVSFVVDSSTTGALLIQFTGPAAPTEVGYGKIPSSAGVGNVNAFGTNLEVSSAGSAASTWWPILVAGTLVNGANAGTVTALFQLSGTGSVKIKTGAYLRWRRIA